MEKFLKFMVNPYKEFTSATNHIAITAYENIAYIEFEGRHLINLELRPQVLKKLLPDYHDQLIVEFFPLFSNSDFDLKYNYLKIHCDRLHSRLMDLYEQQLLILKLINIEPLITINKYEIASINVYSLNKNGR